MIKGYVIFKSPGKGNGKRVNEDPEERIPCRREPQRTWTAEN